MYKRELCICLLYMLLCLTGRSQHIAYQFDNYSLRDGLPSSEVHSILRDSKNYLWFATDHGICKFDGYSFKKIPLPDNTVFHIRQDNKDRVWLGTYTGQLFYVQNDEAYAYKYNSLILQKFNNQLITDFQVANDNSVYISFMQGNAAKIDPDGKLTTNTSEKKIAFCIDQVNEVFFTSNLNSGKKSKSPVRIEVSTPAFTTSTELENDSSLWSPKHRAFRSMNGTIIAHVGKYLVVVSKDKSVQVQPLPSQIFSVAEDQDGDLWVGCRNDGILLLSKKDSKGYTIREKHLEGLSITGIVQDHEGGFWLTSLQKGVFYLRSKYLYFLSPGNRLFNHRISSLAAIDDSLLLIGTPGKGVYLYDRVKNFFHKKNLPGKFDHIFYDSESREAVMLGSEFGISAVEKPFKEKVHSISMIITEGNSNCLKLGDGKYLIGRHSGIFMLDSKDTTLEKLNPDVFRVSYLLQDTDHDILVANQYGLWRFEENKFDYYDTGNPLLKKRFTCMNFFRGKILCLGTRGDGLLIKTDDSIYHISEEHGLVNNNVKKIIATDEDILVMTNKGLSKINILSDEPLRYSIANISYGQGLFATEVNDVCRLNGMLYIASDLGLGFLNESREFGRPRQLELPFYFSQIKINDKPVHHLPAYTLSHTERDITIAYTAISFRDPLGTQYRYRIKGLDTNWTYTASREIRLTSMPYGDFTVEFQATLRSANWTSAVQSIQFSIHPPFWKTWLFIIISLLAVAGLLYFWTRNRINLIRRREEEKTIYNKQIAEMEIRALRAQMNPHFTFNVMQSIQCYISHHDFESARKYLSKFSKLMRTILDHSRFSYIALFDEIGTLRDYLDLEKLRFEDNFDYSIQIEPGLDPHAVRVPTMLIQPYVENAIKHGLSSKEGNARVDISISIKNEHLVCEITDNGIGRKKATELAGMQTEKHVSAGTSLVAERIEALNKYYGYKLRSETLDLYDDNQHAAGTKVVLTIPLIDDTHDKSTINRR